MRAYVRKVLPVVPDGTQLTWSLFDSSSSSFPLVILSDDFIWVTTQSTLCGRYRQHIVNPTQIFDYYYNKHYTNLPASEDFSITFFYLSKSSGNSMVKISSPRIHSEIRAWAVRAEGVLAW